MPNIEVYGLDYVESETMDAKRITLKMKIEYCLADLDCEYVVTFVRSTVFGGEPFIRLHITEDDPKGEIIEKLKTLKMDIEVPSILLDFIPAEK